MFDTGPRQDSESYANYRAPTPEKTRTKEKERPLSPRVIAGQLKGLLQRFQKGVMDDWQQRSKEVRSILQVIHPDVLPGKNEKEKSAFERLARVATTVLDWYRGARAGTAPRPQDIKKNLEVVQAVEAEFAEPELNRPMSVTKAPDRQAEVQRAADRKAAQEADVVSSALRIETIRQTLGLEGPVEPRAETLALSIPDTKKTDERGQEAPPGAGSVEEPVGPRGRAGVKGPERPGAHGSEKLKKLTTRELLGGGAAIVASGLYKAAKAIPEWILAKAEKWADNYMPKWVKDLFPKVAETPKTEKKKPAKSGFGGTEH